MHLSELETPTLMLDLHKVDRNIARLHGRLKGLGVQVRPHLKTCKSINVARRMMEFDTGPVTVSTLKEAEQFALEGVRDILYAVGIAPNKFSHVQRLRAKGLELSLVVDNVQSAGLLAAHARASGDRVPVLIEVDCDGHRCGAGPGSDELLRIADAMAPDCELGGVMTHAGASYGHGRTGELSRHAVGAGVARGRSPGTRSQRRVRADRSLCAVVGRCDGGACRGTTRHPIDQGYGLVCDSNGQPLGDLIMIDANQEHGVLARRAGSQAPALDLPVGTMVRILPNHACATAAQHGTYQVLDQDGTVTAQWPRFGGW